MLIKIMQEAIRIAGPTAKRLAYGLATYERPLFKRAYQGFPRTFRERAYKYYRASTITTIVKPGVDSLIDELQTPSDGLEARQDGKTRGYVVKSGTKRQYSSGNYSNYYKRCRTYKRKRR